MINYHRGLPPIFHRRRYGIQQADAAPHPEAHHPPSADVLPHCV